MYIIALTFIILGIYFTGLFLCRKTITPAMFLYWFPVATFLGILILEGV